MYIYDTEVKSLKEDGYRVYESFRTQGEAESAINEAQIDGWRVVSYKSPHDHQYHVFVKRGAVDKYRHALRNY